MQAQFASVGRRWHTALCVEYRVGAGVYCDFVIDTVVCRLGPVNDGTSATMFEPGSPRRALQRDSGTVEDYAVRIVSQCTRPLASPRSYCRRLTCGAPFVPPPRPQNDLWLFFGIQFAFFVATPLVIALSRLLIAGRANGLLAAVTPPVGRVGAQRTPASALRFLLFELTPWGYYMDLAQAAFSAISCLMFIAVAYSSYDPVSVQASHCSRVTPHLSSPSRPLTPSCRCIFHWRPVSRTHRRRTLSSSSRATFLQTTACACTLRRTRWPSSSRASRCSTL